MTLVEKVARAIVECGEAHPFPSPERVAIAALKTMREPDDDILAPGDDALAEGLGIDAAWQAIFDAALSESDRSHDEGER